MKTVEEIGVDLIDEELHQLVPAQHLNTLGAHGLRGETLFAVPCIIKARPSISGYYRLVLDISGKDYSRSGFDKWIQLEKGSSVNVSDQEIRSLCGTLIALAGQLLEGLDHGISRDLFHELSLLTLGVQLDGSYRVAIGQRAVEAVRFLIENILRERRVKFTWKGRTKTIHFVNAARRSMEIRFASDPDVLVTEYIQGAPRHVLAIEVKGGSDPSNVHNRLGEAEKSHLKLAAQGVLRWTIMGVRIDEQVARKRSPSTNRFFVMSELLAESGTEYEDFKRELISVLGLPE